MSARAQAIGVKGVVLDGRCRDLSEHREAGFAVSRRHLTRPRLLSIKSQVFARGHSTVGQSPFTRPSELQVPITIRDATLPADAAFGSTVVNPHDLVLADVDGVVVVPPSMAEDVVRLAQEGRDVDAKCMEDLKAGRGVKETFAKWRGK